MFYIFDMNSRFMKYEYQNLVYHPYNENSIFWQKPLVVKAQQYCIQLKGFIQNHMF